MMGVREKCPDCGVAIGMQHDIDCDVAVCPQCGQQALTHGDRDGDVDHAAVRTYWTGFWPGVVECRERGWYVVGPPWRPVPPGAPGATEDLNRWAYFRHTGRDELYDPLVAHSPEPEPAPRGIEKFAVLYRTKAGYLGIWADWTTFELAEQCARWRATTTGRPHWVAEVRARVSPGPPITEEVSG